MTGEQTQAVAAPTQAAAKNITHDWAAECGMEARDFYHTVVDTCFPGSPTKSQWNAFALVARNYGLDPIRRQIFAFPSKGGGITPIVGVDGWLAIVNKQPSYDGVEFEYHETDSKLEAITCRIFHKDRKRPTEIKEYMVECVRNTDVWNTSPRRQLRHKAFIQCARVAFSLGGIFDEDDAERIREAEEREAIVVDAASDLDELAEQTETRAGIDVEVGEAGSEPEPEPEPQPETELPAPGGPLQEDDGSPAGAFHGYGGN